MTGREPEDRREGSAEWLTGPERRWPRRLRPSAATIIGAEHRGAEVAGAHPDEDAPTPRILHGVRGVARVTASPEVAGDRVFSARPVIGS